MRWKLLRPETMREELCYDVVVVGGGPSGWVAAVAAARCGAKTALIERYGFFGGAATAGLVVPISGYFKNGRRVVGGIAWEFEQELEKYGAALVELPKGHVSFDPEYYKLVAQRMLLSAGVEPYTNSVFSSVRLANGHIVGLVAECPDGQRVFTAKCFIDATGNGDLCARAGIPMRVSETPQPMSLCFELTGVDVTTALLRDSVHHNGKNGKHSVNTEIHEYLEGLYREGKAPSFGGPWFNTLLKGDRLAVNMTRSADSALDALSLMQAELTMREDMFTLTELLRRKYPEFKNCAISSSAVNAGIREGRHLCGVHTLTGDELLRCEPFADSIARNTHPIDIHGVRGGAQILRETTDAGYIPYRSLISPDCDELLVCGRALSADDTAHASIRVQATAMATGEAAGTAAALCAKNACTVHEVDIPTLRKTLTDNGAIL